tara:strand:- start:1570 stop:2439 length:870 start_codon:yes stop_codon:yes gene_type:complete
MQNGVSYINHFHLAGIVPVAGPRLDFQMDWSDCLMPIAPDYTAIENAVTECLWAGCETIWIVCNDDVSPLIRYRIGDYGMDPVYFNRMNKYNFETKRRIPIFYIPIGTRDRGRRDCLAWSVVHGAARCFSVCARLSKFIAPRKYYVSFPHGIYEPSCVRPHRTSISSVRPFMLTHDGQSVRNGAPLGFTFDADDWKVFRDVIKLRREDLIKKELLEIKNVATTFTLDMVFNNLCTESMEEAEVPWFHSIQSWDEYCTFLGSENRKNICHPGKHVLKYREYNPIGYEPDD